MVKGFNKEMEKYIRGKRTKKIEIRFKKTEPAEGVDIYEEENPSFWSRFFRPKGPQIPEDELSEEERARLEAMEEEMDAIDEAEEDATDPENIEMLEEARESVLERFFQSLRLFKRRHEVDDRMEDVIEAEEELENEREQERAEFKEAMKIAHKWIGKLTKRNRDDFMSSDDYKRWKEILKKNKLAK